MGQGNSLEEKQHIDSYGNPQPATPSTYPGTQQPHHDHHARVPPPVSVNGQQQQPGAPGHPRREDSTNDFAMSIADGAPHGGGNPGNSGSGGGLTPPLPTPSTPSSEAAAATAAASAAAAAAAAATSPPPAPLRVETVPTAFKWVHGGSEVYVTGSFNAWQGKILMYPNEDSEFTLLIDIPPGTHHYKYIVDQEWRLDEDAPTVQIAQVWNNIVEVKRPVFEYTPANFADSDDDEDDRKQKAAYGQRAPLSNDYLADPPKLPPHLTDILLNQTLYVDPMMLPVPLHVVLNHLYVMHHSDPEVLVTGLTQRFKPNPHTRITHKFVTTVYYAPRVTQGVATPGVTTTQSSPSLGPAGMPAGSNPSEPMRQNFVTSQSDSDVNMDGPHRR